MHAEAVCRQPLQAIAQRQFGPRPLPREPGGALPRRGQARAIAVGGRLNRGVSRSAEPIRAGVWWSLREIFPSALGGLAVGAEGSLAESCSMLFACRSSLFWHLDTSEQQFAAMVSAHAAALQRSCLLPRLATNPLFHIAWSAAANAPHLAHHHATTWVAQRRSSVVPQLLHSPTGNDARGEQTWNSIHQHPYFQCRSLHDTASS